MPLSVFEKYIFLQSLGWGIANSLWQAALLWAFYQLATVNNKKLSALFKYHFSLLLLFASFGWFVSTVAQNYTAIKQLDASTNTFGWLAVSKNITDSLQWISVAYFIVLSIHIFRFAKNLKGIFALKNKDLAKAPVGIRLFTEQTAFHIGIKKKVSIWLSQKANVPSVIGFFKPVILLPVTALNHLTTEQAEAVILHELAHIKRNDYIVNYIQCVIEMLLFFNPFTKFIGNTIRRERENCCDDWVMSYQYKKHEYASALLVLEQNRTASIPFALTATNGKKNLLGRVKRLFEEEPTIHFSFLQKIKLLSVSSAILLAVLFVLPLNKQNIAGNTTQANLLVLPSFAKPAVYNYNETEKRPIVNNRPIASKTERKKPIIKTEKITIAAPEEFEYNTALVNQELLNNDKEMQLQQMAIQAANKELQTTQKIIVTIEEEESGKKDKNTYLVEVNNNNGNPEVKPLIILNKKMKALSETTKEKFKKSTTKATLKKRVSA